MSATFALVFVGILALSVPMLFGVTVRTESGGLAPGNTDGAVTYSHASEGYAVMSFPETFVSPSSPPAYACGTLVADGGNPDSPFAGDYIAAGVKSLTFRIKSDGHSPASAMVILQSAQSGRIWINSNFQVSAEAGLWVTVTVPFDRSAGWERGGTGLDAKWVADLRSVGLIGIKISRGGNAAQSYAIDDFMLLDANGVPGGEANLTPLQRALLDRFGVKDPELVSEQDRKVDTDFDGMTDFIEILSKYDILFANSIFEARIVSATDQGVTLRWTCVEGSTYTVFRTGNLIEKFMLLPGDAGVEIQAADTGYMTFVDTDATGPGPYYYRILKRQ